MPCPGLAADGASLQQPSHGYTIRTVYCCSLLPAKQENEKKSSAASRHVLTGMFRRPQHQSQNKTFGTCSPFQNRKSDRPWPPFAAPHSGTQTSNKPAASQQQASRKPAAGLQQASIKPAASKPQASSKPASHRQQASSQHQTSSKCFCSATEGHKLMWPLQVAEAAVIAAPHPKWTERPLLVVVRAEGSQLTKDQMLQFLDVSLCSLSLHLPSLPKSEQAKLYFLPQNISRSYHSIHIMDLQYQ